MPLDIAGSPIWHDIINSPSNTELGNQAAFADPFTQVKDCLNFLKALKGEPVAFDAIVAPGVYGAAAGELAAFDDLVITADQRVLIIGVLQGYSRVDIDDNVFVFGASLQDALDNSYGTLAVALVAEIKNPASSTWFGVVDVPAGTYTPKISYGQSGPTSHIVVGLYGHAWWGALLWPQEGT